ncbi:hypothetical protein [Actinoplanes xinjiangensis]|uniref:hypothetical protein n=1 Tax=Actinoplanes xinjiangensis TaxID=512350 RepID=UPI00344828AC
MIELPNRALSLCGKTDQGEALKEEATLVLLHISLQPFEDGDDIELDDATRELHRSLLEADMEEISRPPLSIEDGAKPVEAFAVGALILAVAPTAIEQVGVVIAAWLQRSNVRSATILIDGDKLTLTKVSKKDQREILRLFVERHSGK